MQLKVSSARWRPLCPGLNVLMGEVVLVVIAGITTLVPYRFKSSLCNWFHLRVPDRQISCSDMSEWQGTSV